MWTDDFSNWKQLIVETKPTHSHTFAHELNQDVALKYIKIYEEYTRSFSSSPVLVSSFRVSLSPSRSSCLLTTHNIAQLAYEDIDNIHFHIALRYDAMRRNQAKYYIIKLFSHIYIKDREAEREKEYPSEFEYHHSTMKKRVCVSPRELCGIQAKKKITKKKRQAKQASKFEASSSKSSVLENQN